MKKKILLVFTIFVLVITSAAVGWFVGQNPESEVISITRNLPKPKPLAAYSIESLSETDINPGMLNIKNVLKEEKGFTSYLFEFEFQPNPEKKTTKTTTGLINIPTERDNFPIVLMLRGYVDQEIYTTGVGTRSAAEFFANNGYITIAPDFLGYADSDEEAGNIFESRFQTYITTLALLQTLEEVSSNPKIVVGPSVLTDQLINHASISIWGHSNGGQIALTVLEITGKDYPTTLWAPVSKPFPYSILYYTDESEDRGKLIRRELAEFEDDYDTDKYSLTENIDKINAPLQIHQGTLDDAVPKDWSDDLTAKLKNLEKTYEYIIHPGADHNMRPDWNNTVQQNLEFFNSFLLL